MKTAIVYSSQTGNTEMMAEQIRMGAEGAGRDVLYSNLADGFPDKAEVLSSDLIILGSPAMGSEVLDDDMEDFFSSMEGDISGKKIAIFGSYDWGDGQWLRDWCDRIEGAGAVCVNGEGLKNHLDEIEEDACRALGATQ
ncbi:MAG: flavodoxin domain-containing protein [Candidatus Methanomethylophilaceae archaeon]|nr:flavodoxin domain-containing protein [Candidatus Methanomethylophilaceae archaeon]